jgi:hypothetical protein
MATEVAPKNQFTFQGLIGLLGLFAGLCAIFALVVSTAEAWREHAQAQWPETRARIEQCAIDTDWSDRRELLRIGCRISYLVGPEEVVTKVYSRSVTSPRGAAWVYPSRQMALLESWVDDHPAGSPIAVHYDPDNHKKAVLVSTDMPYGGPRTPNNLKLLAIAVVACLLLLTIARLLRAGRER